MEVILLQDVKGVGKKGDTKTVSDGYATNFLIPRKLAVKRTEGSVATLNKQVENQKIEEERKKERAIKNKEKLESTYIEFTHKAQKDGTMAGTLSTKAIQDKLKRDYHIEIDKRKFLDKITVNTFGTTILKIELYKDVIAEIKIHVTEEK